MFGGTSIKREAGKELSIDYTLEVTEGTAKVFYGVGGAEPSRCMENVKKAAKAREQRNRRIDTPVYPTDKWHYTDDNSAPGAFKGWVFQDSDLYK